MAGDRPSSGRPERDRGAARPGSDGPVVELQSLIAGYDRFCRDVGLDADAVLACCPLVSERIEAAVACSYQRSPTPSLKRPAMRHFTQYGTGRV